ncbi:DUF4184 family protein [Cellulomonas triticagri]|uniref:DUF4184 family protein n=1 Tax=Cellulomonas triticagri TaxID=2483352 RepID=UPI001315A044|nr:DUF4184 family protein [Cellulomonas triticagri]
MPFTLAHPAAVLPLARRPLVPAALVAGSLSPDVPYFVPLPRSAGTWYEPFVNATTTHAWPGALSVAVPTGLLLVGLWWVVRGPARDLLGVHRDAAAPASRALPTTHAPRALARTVLSVALGVLTHVVWDSFTHGDGVVVQHVAWLREPLVGSVTAGRVLQHTSTAVGLGALAVVAVRALRRHRTRLAVDRGRVAVLVGLAVAAAVGATVAVAGTDAPGVEVALAAAAKGGGTALVTAVLVAAGAYRLARDARPRTAGRRAATGL